MSKWLLAVLLTGCLPLPAKSTVKAGQIWAQPGSPTTFTWSMRETTHRVWGPDFDHHNFDFDTTESTEVDRTWVTSLDPSTGTTTQLTTVRAAVKPFYWDAQRGVLWVTDDRHSLLGLTAGDAVRPPGTGAEFHTRDDLPAPFAMASEGRTTFIFDAATNATIALDHEAGGTPIVDGSLLRLVRTVDEVGAVVVEETVIDWSRAQPVRFADVMWTTPGLAESAGVRDAFAVMPDGRHFAEVVTTDETRVYVYDMIRGGAPAVLAVTSPGEHAKLYPLAGDVVLYATAGSPCWQGSLIAAGRRIVKPVAGDDCIKSVAGAAGRRFVDLEGTSGYVDASLAIVDTGVKLTHALVLGPTTIAYARPERDGPGVVVDKLDLATGVVTQLGRHASRADTLLDIYDSSLVFVGPANTLVTEHVGGAPTTVALPAMVQDGPDGEPLAYEVAGIGVPIERTKLWIAFRMGGTSNGKLAFETTFELQRFMTSRVALSTGLLIRADDNDAAHRADIGGTIGVAAFASRHRHGWFAEADVAASKSTTRVDKQIVDVSFAPSAELRMGHKGRLLGIEVAAVAPSLVDRDRGTMFVAGLSLGPMGINR